MAKPGGVRSVVAESVLTRHQLLVLNRGRKRAPELRVSAGESWHHSGRFWCCQFRRLTLADTPRVDETLSSTGSPAREIRHHLAATKWYPPAPSTGALRLHLRGAGTRVIEPAGTSAYTGGVEVIRVAGDSPIACAPRSLRLIG